jgi:hypothetical protein
MTWHQYLIVSWGEEHFKKQLITDENYSALRNEEIGDYTPPSAPASCTPNTAEGRIKKKFGFC